MDYLPVMEVSSMEMGLPGINSSVMGAFGRHWVGVGRFPAPGNHCIHWFVAIEPFCPLLPLSHLFPDLDPPLCLI
jgi:hypothetical protein